MKRMSPSRKSSKPDVQAKRASVSSGPEAAALTPPAYGIEFLDRSSSRSEPAPLQANEGAAIAPAPPAATVHQTAQKGMSGASSSLPYLDVIQSSFGRHDVSGVRAFTGGAARVANRQMGSLAYTSGDAVVFGGAPDLHTSAHEAAHVVQQRAGVRLKDNIGRAGDEYERHADAVADAVVQGRSAEGLLTTMAGDTARASAETPTQHKHGPIQYDFRGGKGGTVGSDPVEEYTAAPDAPSLLFGLDTYRRKTKARVRDALKGKAEYDGKLLTVDDYNLILGLADTVRNAPGIFVVREWLEDPKSWHERIGRKPGGENPDLHGWMDMLVEDKEKIGLYDFGDQDKVSVKVGRTVMGRQMGTYSVKQPRGLTLINSKERLGKNLTADKSGDISAEKINHFLREENDFTSAIKEYKEMSKTEKEALDKWVSMALLRRTSKLAIDFTIHRLGAKIHFNLAGLTKRGSEGPPNLDGLLAANAGDQSVDRAVTISELRHILREIGRGSISEESINWYNEW